MNKKVTNILSWKSTTGAEKALFLITNKEKHHKEMGYRWLEICSKNKETDQWKTEEKIDHVDEILSSGIPPSLVD